MKKIIFTVLILMLAIGSKAQQARTEAPEKAKERIESYRAQFITEKLDLSPEEAQVFWPIFNEYRDKLESINTDQAGNLTKVRGKKPEELTDQEIEELIKAEFKRQRKVIDLREEYYAKFKKVIPIKKVALLYKAEVEFQKKLLERLSHRGQRREK